jgi:NTE family protein
MEQKEFSLILGGGAARGLAHIWLIRKLEELKIVPSLIVGTSMGGIIGALYAHGYTSHEIQKIAQDTSLVRLIDIDTQKGGIKWDRLTKYLESLLSHAQFSGLKIPLKIIATNIDTGEKMA